MRHNRAENIRKRHVPTGRAAPPACGDVTLGHTAVLFGRTDYKVIVPRGLFLSVEVSAPLLSGTGQKDTLDAVRPQDAWRERTGPKMKAPPTKVNLSPARPPRRGYRYKVYSSVYIARSQLETLSAAWKKEAAATSRRRRNRRWKVGVELCRLHGLPDRCETLEKGSAGKGGLAPTVRGDHVFSGSRGAHSRRDCWRTRAPTLPVTNSLVLADVTVGGALWNSDRALGSVGHENSAAGTHRASVILSPQQTERHREGRGRDRLCQRFFIWIPQLNSLSPKGLVALTNVKSTPGHVLGVEKPNI